MLGVLNIIPNPTSKCRDLQYKIAQKYLSLKLILYLMFILIKKTKTKRTHTLKTPPYACDSTACALRDQDWVGGSDHTL